MKVNTQDPKFQVRSPFVFVKRLPEETCTPGGLILPDEQDFRNRKCVVVATHAGRKLEDGSVVRCLVSPGATIELIIFDNMTKVNDQLDKEMEIAHEKDILAYYDDSREFPLVPLEGRVVVKKVESEDRTKGGLWLPDMVKVESNTGVVVATGEGRVNNDGTREPVEVQPRDKVLFTKYQGVDVKIAGEKYAILSGNDVLAVFGNDDE